jgi:hypothetical protein
MCLRRAEVAFALFVLLQSRRPAPAAETSKTIM